MKLVCGAILFFAAAVLAACADETNPTLTVDGVTYSNVTFGTVTPPSVSIIHSTGIARVPLKSLPPEIQKQLGYDPEKMQADAAKAKATAEAARVEAAVVAETARAKAEDARVKAKGAKKTVTEGERDFTVDVFIRTKGGESIKCGLVTVLVYDEEAIQSWQPRITKVLAAHAFDLESNARVAKSRMEVADKVWKVAAQNKEVAIKKWIDKLDQAVQHDKYFGPGAAWRMQLDDIQNYGTEYNAYTRHIKEIAPADLNAVLRSLDEEKNKASARAKAEKEWLYASSFGWLNTVSTAVLESLPQPVTTAKTDADGRCTGKVTKPGTYAFVPTSRVT